MDLKIKDVAELLNVSETTIRRWLTDGRIPAYRINSQYRFSRIEIENWVMSQRLSKGQTAKAAASAADEGAAGHKGGLQQFSLYRALHKGNVYHHIGGETKAEVIRHTMEAGAEELGLDADVLTDLLLDRESLMPTALNNGIGVPHTRDFLLDPYQDCVVIVFLEKPIDYGALDGKPVHTLFFLFASDDKRHLNLLAKIAHLTSFDQARALFATRPDKATLLEFIREWEGSIGSSREKYAPQSSASLQASS